MFGEKVNPGGNLFFGLLSQTAKVIPALTDTESGVSLLPDSFIKRIIILIQREDNGEKGIILNRAFHFAVIATQHLNGIITQLVTNPFFVKPGSRYAKQKRLQSCAGCSFQNVPDITGFMRMKFVDDPTMDIETIQIVGIRR